MEGYQFDSSRFVIDSHRGAFKEGLLENTIPAFLQSYREGANVMECDIRRTNDGQILLLHNSTIDHIATFAEKTPEFEEFHEIPSGRLRNHSLDFMKAMKFPNDAQLLTLPEFLEFLAKYKIGAQVELKEMGYEEEILKAFSETDIPYEDLLGPIVCTSFNFLAIRRLIKKAKQYNIPLYDHTGKPGLAFGFQAIQMGALYGGLIMKKFQQYNVWGGMTHYRYMPIKQLPKAHKFGIKFCPRVPDKKELIMQYIDAGVDGFETDNVPLIRECLEQKGIELWPLPKQ